MGKRAADPSVPELAERVAHLERTLAATSEVLRSISRGPTELQPVLDAIVESAARLCDAESGAIQQRDGDRMRVVAFAMRTERARTVFERLTDVANTRFAPTTVSGRAMLERRTVAVEDMAEAVREEFPDGREVQRIAGQRSQVVTPLLREGEPIGVVALHRYDVRPFTEAQIKLLETFADQAVIAIENARLLGELREQLEQQTATSEILRVISASPGDLGPVLEAVSERATRLCQAADAGIYLVDGDALVSAVSFGNWGRTIREEVMRVPLVRGSVTARSVLERRTIHVDDLAAVSEDEYPVGREIQQRTGIRTIVAAPLVREGRAIGTIAVIRQEVRPFTPRQVALLETFADQAAIAMENARLFGELAERNGELRQALEQQTATAEVLKVISRAPTDLQKVLDTIAESAARLCESETGIVFRLENGAFRVGGGHGVSPVLDELLKRTPAGPDRKTTTGRAALERRTIHIPDVLIDPEYGRHDAQQAESYRSTLATPLLRDDELLGVLTVWRKRVAPFSEREQELVSVFADQAVIAIENARLFSELQERLEEQTATSEVLRAISGSPTDLSPVLEAIAESAARLCGVDDLVLWRPEGDRLVAAAIRGSVPPAVVTSRQLLDRTGGAVVAAFRDGRTVHIPDGEAPEAALYRESLAPLLALGYRTFLAAPLLREGRPIGVISTRHRQTNAFTPRQVALLETFASQATIAIENARLFSELQQRTGELARSVEQLTALGEVSQTVTSTLDAQRVLDAVVAHATELSGSDGGAVYEYDEATERLHLRAANSFDAELVAAMRANPLRVGEGATGRAVAIRQPVSVPDMSVAGAYESGVRAAALQAGLRAFLAVPLLREEQIVGGLVLGRRTPGDYPPETVRLLQTFAAQSALALQNARLFSQLDQASRHKSEFLANMSHELRTPLNAIIGFTEVLLERYFGEVNEKQDEYLRDVLSSGQHLLSLINDILDLSKVEAGRMELELSTFALQPVLEAGLVMVKERAQKQGVQLGLDVADDTGRVEADERKVKQVLFNLLSNAVKFTPSGGRVDVKTWREDGRVYLAVRDTGVGVPPEEQGRVFEEFGQARAGRRQGEGTGLGLSLVKRFAELHGGSVALESRVGEGSTFTVSLPVRQEAAVAR